MVRLNIIADLDCIITRFFVSAIFFAISVCSFVTKAETVEPVVVEISGVIDDSVANEIETLFLKHETETFENNIDVPIRIIIDSPGGNLYAALGIIDMMQCVSFTVETECKGLAASSAALILAMGDQGHRFAHSGSKILIHYASCKECAGPDESINKGLDARNEEFITLLSTHSYLSIPEIKSAIANSGGELWLTPEQAKEFGIIDVIIN